MSARRNRSIGIACLALAYAGGALGQDAAPPAAPAISAIDTLWVLVCAMLVFFMQAGFAMLEAGLVRAKNAANVLLKNLLDFCAGSIGYFMVGYAFMYGSTALLIGTGGFFLIGAESPAPNLPLPAFWIFQVVFAGTTATIVSGAVAERMKFGTYIAYSFLMTSFLYPVVGHWIWGGGWLARMGFHDFAGSTVVHTVGGVSALVAARLLGPRIGRFNPDGSPAFIGAHNIPLATLGVFILWFGWFGFNPGSTLGLSDPALPARIAVTTTLAASAGTLAALVTVWRKFGKPDVSIIMNGTLAGLVAITAGCATVDYVSAIAIGAVAGVLVIYAIHGLNRWRIDDAVGAFPVHGVCGVFGTLAVGLFGQKALGAPSDGLLFGGGFHALGVQSLGALSAVAFTGAVMWVIFKALDATMGLRVPEETELRGLDVEEHGLESYGGFQIFVNE